MAGKRKTEARLAAAAQLEIDLGQKLTVEQGAVQGAVGVVDAVRAV